MLKQIFFNEITSLPTVENTNDIGSFYAEQLVAALGIDSNSSTPLYLQVRNGLTRLIKKSHFGANAVLPSERALAEMLGISRVTARKAIDALASNGLIVRRHGSGNYIAPLLEQPLNRLFSLTQELTSRGFAPGTQWIRRAVDMAMPEEMVALSLAPGTRVAKLARVRLADGTPIAVECSTLPLDMAPEPEVVTDSLYAFLTGRGLAPVRATQHIRAINATAHHAELLGIPEGNALLLMTRIGYLDDNRPVEFTNTWCRSDYKFMIELQR